MPIDPAYKDRIVPVIVPSRSNQGAVGRTIANVFSVLIHRGRVPIYTEIIGFGYVFVRSDIFTATREIIGMDTVRGILLDDDILIEDPVAFDEVITEADRRNINITARYNLADGSTSLLHDNGIRRMTAKEADDLKPWSTVRACGLGFYYGHIPLTYKFHEGGVYLGEDLNFFADNNITVHVAPLKLFHVKSVCL